MNHQVTVKVQIKKNGARFDRRFGGLRVKMAIVNKALAFADRVDTLVDSETESLFDVHFEYRVSYVWFYKHLTVCGITQPNLFDNTDKLVINYPDKNGMIANLRDSKEVMTCKT
jgi:hypothetical protein